MTTFGEGYPLMREQRSAFEMEGSGGMNSERSASAPIAVLCFAAFVTFLVLFITQKSDTKTYTFIENIPELQEYHSQADTTAYRELNAHPELTTVWYVQVPGRSPNYDTWSALQTALTARQSGGSPISRLTVMFGPYTNTSEALLLGEWGAAYVMDYLNVRSFHRPRGGSVALSVAGESISAQIHETPLSPYVTLGAVTFNAGIKYVNLDGIRFMGSGPDPVLHGLAAPTGTIPAGSQLCVTDCVLAADTTDSSSAIMTLRGVFSGAVVFVGNTMTGSRAACAFETTDCVVGSYLSWFIMWGNYWHDNQGSGATRGRDATCTWTQPLMGPPVDVSDGISYTAIIYQNVLHTSARHASAWGIMEVKNYKRVVMDSNTLDLEYEQRCSKTYIGLYAFVPAANQCPWTLRVTNNIFVGAQSGINIPWNRTLDSSATAKHYPYYMPTDVAIMNNTIEYDSVCGAGINFQYRYYNTAPTPVGQMVMGADAYTMRQQSLTDQLLINNVFKPVNFTAM